MSVPANSLDITQAGLVKFDGSANFTGVTVTQYDVLVGSSSNGITSVSPSTSGKVLTSNGVSADPSFETISNANLPGSGQITLSNGTNVSVTGSPVALGGSATINVSGPPSATTLTSNGVVYGQGTSAIAATAAGLTNRVLLGNTGSAPSFGTVPNAALTNSSITLSNGNNVTITGSPVSLGGTATVNVSGTTNHAVQVGNATNSLTSLAVGTTGQVLLGATGANPSWNTPTAGSGLSITTNATTLAYAISAPVSIANGGTNATSFATAGAPVLYDGTRLVTGGVSTNSSQPMLSAAFVHTPISNVTGDGTIYGPVVFDSIGSQQGSNYNASTGVYTCPAAGVYLVCVNITFTGVSVAFTSGEINIRTNTNTLTRREFNPGVGLVGTDYAVNDAYAIKVSASDTISVNVVVSGSTKTIGIKADSFGQYSYISIMKLA